MVKAVMQKLVGIISICLLVVSSLTAFLPAQPVYAAEPRDCDSNAVLFCGAYSTSELKTKYRKNQGGDTKAIFSHFGMKSESSLNGMVNGRVTKSGDIYAGSKKVATGAVTAGRHKMGSDEVKVPGANAWMRPPSRSFRSSSLDAFVKLNSRGEFVYGVIKSCGNPVQAQNKFKFPPKEKPQPKPAPKKPGLDIEKDVRVLGDSDWEQHVAADPDAEVQYRITIKNTGETDLKNVEVQDSLPSGVSFEDVDLDTAPSGSGVDATISDLVGSGVELGTLPKGEVREIRFVVAVGSDVDACDVPMRNVASADADDVPEVDDDALVTVCQPEEEKPQVKADVDKPAPTKLPETGAAGALGIFSVTSILGFAAYKLKEFYSTFLG